MLWNLADRIGSWKPLGRALLNFNEARLTAFEKENPELSEQAYKMLRHWKENNGSAATYQILFDKLALVSRRDLGEEFCCE